MGLRRATNPVHVAPEYDAGSLPREGEGKTSCTGGVGKVTPVKKQRGVERTNGDRGADRLKKERARVNPQKKKTDPREVSARRSRRPTTIREKVKQMWVKGTV